MFAGQTQRVPVVAVRVLLPGQGASELEEEEELLTTVVFTHVVSDLHKLVWMPSPSSTRRKFAGQMQVPSVVAT